MPLPLRDFVSRCIGEKDRLSIEDLLSHAFTKVPIHRPIQEPEESQEDSQDQPRDSIVPRLAAPSNLTMDTPGGHASLFPSRLHSEFETLQFLGSGGFGDVLKVKNKLDGNEYAIKRILLDAKSRQLNKKITREVKLLSRLNHENIVRYYNSWLETVQRVEPQPAAKMNGQQGDGIVAKDTTADSDSSLFSSPNKGRWFAKPRASHSSNSSSSGGIAFEADSDALDTSSSEEESSKEEAEEDTVDAPTSFSSPSVHPPSLQYMYIQMEYCEKSTLRTAIDSELYLDKSRIWRLFREIVEGLAYIHTSGIIHRDLKVRLGSYDFIFVLVIYSLLFSVCLRSPSTFSLIFGTMLKLVTLDWPLLAAFMGQDCPERTSRMENGSVEHSRQKNPTK